MKQSIQINYQQLTFDELTAGDGQLVRLARQAMDGAHAPYSHFHVGSAVLMADGTTVTGNNQENAAYPSGLCAERVALFAAKSQSRQPISTIAVVARNEENLPADAFSCGNCRQVMLEYASLQPSPIRVIMGSRHEHYLLIEDVRELLPFTFESTTLRS